MEIFEIPKFSGEYKSSFAHNKVFSGIFSFETVTTLLSYNNITSLVKRFIISSICYPHKLIVLSTFADKNLCYFKKCARKYLLSFVTEKGNNITFQSILWNFYEFPWISNGLCLLWRLFSKLLIFYRNVQKLSLFCMISKWYIFKVSDILKSYYDCIFSMFTENS